MSRSELEGQVVLITGAANGIGAAVARLLAESGARPVLLDVDAEHGEPLAAELDGLFLHTDVSRRADWQAAVARCVETVGEPAFAHLNAGVMSVPPDAPLTPLADLPEASVRRIIDVNLWGVVHGLQCLLPLMRSRPGGICVTASLVGLVPLAVDPLYAATKHALVGLVRSLAAAEADGALRINAICPGGVDTAIVPAALRAAGLDVMPAALLAQDVVELLVRGANGEIRLRRSADGPATAVAAPELG